MPEITCTILAGPNGSGKTSAFGKLNLEGEYINADEIAGTLTSGGSKSIERQAAELALQRIAEKISKRSFIFETTLSSQQSIRLMRDAKAAGFKVDLYYVILDTVERSIERVKFRVALGGHDVPEDAIRRRYKGSLRHLPQAIALTDEAVIADNSEIRPRIVFQINNGYVFHTSQIPGNPLHELLTEKVQQSLHLRG
ncbi:zeta toxin family protein (plasmid) [Rhizobium sp. CB3171]|uniref:zeta toxin family protein n=1 Tax=Rhizobium sp. CB3171 TaxID=3039157 RepID=UPI0024B1C0B6|nr:zeta toxin family protein [Rhizobium sp. CB3171]WFU07401.1 zeta toxin family protein [Rhizobium sp. CB3171]